MVLISFNKTLQYRLFERSFTLSKRCISGLNLWNEEISTEIKHKIESHWRDKLKTEYFNENTTDKEKYYVLSMFPYPSGFLHMGHVRVYTISDAVARYQRMNGKNVIHPIGWDAFGLPAENAAIDHQIPPDEWTKKNISHMKSQLEHLGCSFDWDREITTCQPEYYHWTQELFLKLYDAGLVYRKEALVNWDPVDQTVLADEQVDDNGCSWRSGAKVEKKLLNQWFVRTTKFAKDLLQGLDDSILQDWRDIIKLQRHWIGDCNGVNFDFKIVNDESNFVTLWTETPEYIEHVKFVAVTPNHIFAKKANISDDQTKLLDVRLKNPLTGDLVPVFVTRELDFHPNTDSFVGIPGVDANARYFAGKYGIICEDLPIIEDNDSKRVVQGEVCKRAQSLGAGGYWTSANLRDWLISRQRYWGTPIPIVHCGSCGAVPVPREHLPVQLPKLSKLSQKGGTLLKEITEWLHTDCPKCGGQATRETDTMDTFVDSSWYYLRYLDPKNDGSMFGVEKAKRMMPVDLYIGGKEHAVLHLYYARFVSHFLHSLDLLPEREPFKRLLVQGMVMGRTYRIKGTGQYLPEDRIEVVDKKRSQAKVKETGEPVVMSWEKMSKSKHNGVDPSDMFEEYGVDTTRLLVLADVAPTSHRNWNTNTFPGVLNWQKRLWLTIRDFIEHRTNQPPMISEDEFKATEDYLFDSRNYYTKGASFNYVISQQMSVAVSKQQGLTNSIRRSPPAIYAYGPQFELALATQIILLAPMAPHFASELWAGFVSAPNRLSVDGRIQWDKQVLEQKWPETDMAYNLDLCCLTNGIERCSVKIPRRNLEMLTKEEALNIALKQEEIQNKLNTRNVLDVVYTAHPGFDSSINIRTEKLQKVKETKTVEN